MVYGITKKIAIIGTIISSCHYLCFFFFNVFVSLLIFWGQCLVIIFLNGIPYIGPEETSRITFRGRSAKVDIYAKRKAHSLGY